MNLAVFSALILTALLLPPASAVGQTAPKWSYGFDATFNVLPGQEDFVQPTGTADRGTLHLESRYNYEDRESISGFVGWNYETQRQDKWHLALTPMFGGVAGSIGGVIPSLELTLDYGKLELDAEDEYVIEVSQSSDSFFYHWSELTFAPSAWFAAGLAIQRSRVIHSSRDTQTGPMARVTKGPVEAGFYFFNLGTDDRYFNGSIGVTF